MTTAMRGTRFAASGLRVASLGLFALLAVSLVASVLPVRQVHAAAIQYIGSATDSAGTATTCTSAVNTCSLRDALHAAAGGDTIALAPAFNFPVAVTLTGGPLSVATNVTIEGARLLTVDGGCLGCNPGGTPTGGATVFVVNAGVTATLDGITIQHGNAGGPGGGGILNNGTLSVNGCLVSENVTPGAGGGIANNGALTVTGSTFTSNVGYYGGGIGSNNTLTVTASTFDRNSAQYGGGISAFSTTTVTNSTFSGNTALGPASGVFGGGGIGSQGALTLRDSTLSGNVAAGYGGGVYNQSPGTATLIGTITAGNSLSGPGGNGPDVSGIVTGGSANNLIGTGSGLLGISTGMGGNQIGTDAALINPRLGPLAGNGGLTQTFALLPNSPAIDAGGTCPIGVTSDQRGIARPRGAACDIGAYEYVPVAPSITGIAPGSLTSAGGTAFITGTGFQTGTAVTVGGQAATGVTVAADGLSLMAGLPAHAAGSLPVVVTNPGNLTAMTTLAYTPTIAAIGPSSGSAAGGLPVTITGAGFAAGGTSVTFGAVAGTVTSVTPTTITVTPPQHAAGAVTVTVTVNGQSAVAPGMYTFGIVSALPSPQPASSTAGGPPSTLPTTRPIDATGANSGGAAPNALPAARP